MSTTIHGGKQHVVWGPQLNNSPLNIKKGIKMPNWVYNAISINGSKEELEIIRHELSVLRPYQLHKGEITMQVFNFHSIITPSSSIWDEYDGEQPRTTSIEESLKFASNHWYDWNIRNWGSKWEPTDEEISTNLDEESDMYFLDYNFNTAWSPPEHIIYGLARRIKEAGLSATFTWCFEEEQGWGGEWYGGDGRAYITSEWDIPNSHADYEDRGRECYCLGRGEAIFDDCPSSTEQDEEEPKG